MNEPAPQGPSHDELYERFVPLFVAHEAKLRSFLRTMLPRWDQIDDVMQQTSLVAWRKFGDFDPNTNFMAWVGAIARFEALHVMRDRARERLTFSSDLLDFMADEALQEVDVRERERTALTRCIEKLPSREKELLQLAYQPGVRFHEVADQLGRSTQGVYKALQRLRGRLTECAQRELNATGHE